MPVWPFLMAAAGGLTVWGLFKSAWEAPALMLVGYILTRAAVEAVAPDFLEVALCALWLCIAAVLVYREHTVPGLLLTLSALSYPVLLVFGFRAEYMTLAPILADGFAIAAMVWIGGGLYGFRSGIDPIDDRCGIVVRQEADSLGVAEGRFTMGQGD